MCFLVLGIQNLVVYVYYVLFHNVHSYPPFNNNIPMSQAFVMH